MQRYYKNSYRLIARLYDKWRYMEHIVKQLLQCGKEGLWWDFKLKHHENIAALVHDIICMANVIHDGNRYIIFGISDSLEVIGLSKEDKSYTQADIINHLRKLAFSEHNIPNIQLNSLTFNDVDIAVLTIFNERLKPYYLTQEFRFQNKLIRAGVVYSRVEDTNTPLDSCANPCDVKAMWSERFGLDLPAPKRFSTILEDSENWVYDGINKAYYAIDPDFTIDIGEVECEGGNYWWQNIPIEKTKQYTYYLKYKNAVIKDLLVVHYKKENLTIPFPDIEFITYPNANDGFDADFYCDLYYFQKNTLKYSLFKHLREIEISTVTEMTFTSPISSQIKPPIIRLPFFIIDSDSERLKLQAEFKERYKAFMLYRKEQLQSRFPDGDYNRWDIERMFSEWVFAQLM